MQSIFYVPHFISWVVLGGIIITIHSPSTGIVNYILVMFGIEPIYFMASEKWWPAAYVVGDIWQSAGWGTIVYLAAITNVDMDLFEAAGVDGANKFQKVLHITLPSIVSTVVVMLILRVGKIMDCNFEQIYALQNDAVRSVSEVFSTYEYRIGPQGAQYSDKEHHFRLIYSYLYSGGAYTPKPAFVAYAVLARQLTGFQFDRFTYLPFDGAALGGVYWVCFLSGGDSVNVVWSLEERAVGIQGEGTVTDMMGKTTVLEEKTLQINSAPVYIHGDITVS